MAPPETCRRHDTSLRARLSNVGTLVAKAPIHLYRWTIRPCTGRPYRHPPTCSDYALEAIDRNGPWRGLWLTLSRLQRCRPGGSSGIDPPPDIRREHHPLAPWRYGRWTGAHIDEPWPRHPK